MERNCILDAWRGVSVLLVIFGHLIHERGERYLGPIAKPLFDVLVNTGTLGVQCFFVISGYIITALLLKERERTGRISWAAFAVRRAFRILPALGLVLVATLVFARMGDIRVSTESFLLAATFRCNTSPEACGWYLAHLWSLAVEEQFYIAWPLILIVGWRWGVERLAFALLILFVVLSQTMPLVDGWLNNGLSFACIAAGALYASSKGFRERVSDIRWPLLVVSGVLLLTMPLLPRLFGALSPLLISLVLFSSLRGVDNVAVRGLAAVGVISYGLYLWQQIFLSRGYLQSSVLQFTPLLAVVPVLSFYLMERPLIRIGATLSGRLRSYVPA